MLETTNSPCWKWLGGSKKKSKMEKLKRSHNISIFFQNLYPQPEWETNKGKIMESWRWLPHSPSLHPNKEWRIARGWLKSLMKPRKVWLRSVPPKGWMGSFLIDHHLSLVATKLDLMSEGESNADQNLKILQKSRIGYLYTQLEKKLIVMMLKQIKQWICLAKPGKPMEFNLTIPDFWS